MRLLKPLLLLLLFLSLFIVYIFFSTGFFKTVENKFEGDILKRVPIVGAEDIMISTEDKFALISSTDRAHLIPESERQNGLYLIDLTDDSYTPIYLSGSFNKPFNPHGISFYKKDSFYQVMAINHTDNGHFIEMFELNDKTLTHIKTLRDDAMIQPNDLVMVDENRFYFTNDHGYTEGIGKFVEDYIGIGFSNVVYFDGQNYSVVSDRIAYANGINVDKKRNLVYVASVRKFLVKVYILEDDGSLSFVEDIPCGTGVDNIELDTEGNLWIGSHPNLMVLSTHLKTGEGISPSEIIKINYRAKGDYTISQIYTEEGEEMSGSTVAAVYEDLIFMGNVVEKDFLILKQN